MLRSYVPSVGSRRRLAAAGGLALLAAALAVLLSGRGPATAAVGAVYNDVACRANQLPANDDGSTGQVPLGFIINYFGTQYSEVYVNNNGNVTFDSPLSTYTPEPIVSAGEVIIAPFWADVDTRGDAADPVTYGQSQFGGRPVFCANWLNAGYFSGNDDKLNDFQLLIVNRSDVGAGDFDIIMNYDSVLWDTGDASDGANGLCDPSEPDPSPARAGYSNGADVSFEFPGSDVCGAFLNGAPTGLSHNSRNSLVLGRFVFEVRNGLPPAGGAITGRVVGPPRPPPLSAGDGLFPLEGALVTVCATPPCATTSTNSEGRFIVTGLAPGDYHVIAYPPAGRTDILPADAAVTLPADQSVDVGDLGALRPTPPPQGTTIGSIGSVSGVPVLDWGRATPFGVSGCEDGSASYRLVAPNGTVLASGPLSETSAGTYSGTIPGLLPYHGPARVEVDIDCPDGDEEVDFDVYIDPSGIVRSTADQPIADATVSLYRADSAAGPFEIVPDGSAVMSPSNRANPDSTDSEGRFHWDVVAGYYRVRAEATGCVDPENAAQDYVETDVLVIPPPATDLELVLDCGGGPPPVQVQWGDVDCNGTVTIGDAQKVGRSLVGLSITQTPPCPGLQGQTTADGSSVIWGDVDCSGGVTIGDAQKIGRFLVGLAITQTPPCFDVDEEVSLEIS